MIAFLVASVAHGDQQEMTPTMKSDLQQKRIKRVLAENADSLMALPGVVAVAQGECGGEPCIKIYATKSTPDLLERIPSTIEGFSTTVEESGEIRALE